MIPGRFAIKAKFYDEYAYYWWAGRDADRASLWTTIFAEAYRVPGLHYLRNIAQRELPDGVNYVNGTKTELTPRDFEVIDVGIE